MKDKWKRNVLWLMAIVVEVALTGCPSDKPEAPVDVNDRKVSEDLVVVEQADSIFNSNDEKAAFMVDVPLSGPQALVDSVMALVNRELYLACEDCVHFNEEIKSFSPEEVFTNDGEHLLGHYMEYYMGQLQDSLWKSFFNFTMKKEAETANYVTYAMEHYHCGGSCGSELYFYTFDKRDGHQIGEVISHDNLVRFFKDHSEFATIEDLIDEYDWEFDPEVVFENTKFGLLDDRFILVIDGFGNHYFNAEYPYSVISPYLSPEAQALVGQEN